MSSVAGFQRWAAAWSCALALGVLAVLPARAAAVPMNAAAAVTHGTVHSVERIRSDRPHGAGALVGGILGAAVGRQFADSAHGRNVGAAVGAAAGALIGNEIEKGVRRNRAAVRISVVVDDGSPRDFYFRESGGDLRPGDRVRIVGNMLYRVC